MARLRYTASASVSGYNSGGSFLWTWLLCGLLATLINVFYEASTTLGRLHLSRFDPVHGELVLNAETSIVSPPETPRKAQTKDEDENSSSEVDSILVDWKHLDPELVKEKGPLIKLIRDAGFTDITVAKLKELPAWSQVTDLYGEKPVLYGLTEETCQRFRRLPNPALHFISTAGTFNTGTNLMSELLIANCHILEHEALDNGKGGAGIRWQVVWGKHTPVDDESFRLTHRTYKDPNYNAQNIFPAVMVRDPYKWMQSMCRHPYGALWRKDKDNEAHCPNLVRPKTGKTYNVTVEYAEFKRHHDSLVGFWNDWYQAYVDASFPRVVVRFEDLIYHPKDVVKQVCECAGGELRKRGFKYVVDSAKKGDQAHGDKKLRTSYLDALIRYGTRKGRYDGFQTADLDYAKQHLSPKLMQAFQYPFDNRKKDDRDDSEEEEKTQEEDANKQGDGEDANKQEGEEEEENKEGEEEEENKEGDEEEENKEGDEEGGNKEEDEEKEEANNEEDEEKEEANNEEDENEEDQTEEK